MNITEGTDRAMAGLTIIHARLLIACRLYKPIYDQSFASLAASAYVNSAVFGPGGFIIAGGIHFTSGARHDFGGGHPMVHDDVFDAVGALAS
jgi:hypothetical protein